MKKICTFTLEGEDYPSKDYGDKLRLFAYMLYDLVYNYYGDGIIPLNINKNIVYNKLHVGFMNSGYFFDSDVFDNGFINYEPFLIGTHSFGLTILDNLISEDISPNKSSDGKIYSYNIDNKAISLYLSDKDIEKMVALDNNITYSLEYAVIK